MSKGISAHLTLAIQATTGKTMREFADQVMGLKYGTFMYRIRNGCLRLDDYIKILDVLPGYSFETLFWKQLPIAISSRQPSASLPPEPIEIKSSRQGEGATEPVHLVKEYPPEQKREPSPAPFVLPDLPLTMPD